MCKCSHTNCKFDLYLLIKQNKEVYYFKDKKNLDTYCIFHAPLKIKQNFRISQKELFFHIIQDYLDKAISDRINVDFSNVTFVKYDFKNKDLRNLDVDFTHVTFIENVRFDNIKCNKLILKDTKFLDGGCIKNREKDKNLYIKELEFRPYALESDFVIDIGGYVNDKGLLEFDKQGIIESLKFENHKIGNGKIFFIGFNDYLQKADFRNMILDKVFFQNCDLKNCYFLNSKINSTEFRNCYFPKNENRKFNNDILGQKNSVASILFVFMSPFIFIYLLGFIQIDNIFNNILSLIYAILIISFTFIFFASLNSLEQFISHYIRMFLNWLSRKEYSNTQNLSSLQKSFNVHNCIADENEIYKTMDENATKNQPNFSIKKGTLEITLDSLSSSYSQLKDNFKDKDFQISGDFFYSQRYTEILANSNRSFHDLLLYNVHQLTNGFGESYMKPLIWFIITLFCFSFVFVPNKDYTSTSATPLFLIKNAYTIDDNQESLSVLYKKDDRNLMYKNGSFYKSMIIEDNNSTNPNILYGYDNRYDYKPQEQYILRLDTKYPRINLIHSFSNMIYPFTPEQKRWFQNISEKAVLISLLESLLLWYFAIAFVLALWHRIKR